MSFKRIHSAFLALAPLSALTPEFCASLCASKVILSDLASKKRPVWTAQMPVLDWLFLRMEPRRLELLTPCIP